MMSNFCRQVVICLCVFLFAGSLSAAEVQIQGVVLDERTGEPMTGANVFIAGTNTGAATDPEGKFSFEFEATEEFSLVVSFIGYKQYTQSYLPYDNLSNLEIKLREDFFLTEEVVVTGIANQRSKSRSEVAVGRVSAALITEKQNYTSVDQLVNGKLSGVQVRSSSGNVGSGFRFFVRSGGGLNGNEQPVIYIDGVRIDNAEIAPFFTGGQGLGTLSDINPDDIEDIEVLKGPAAAASYGTSGSNGVVLITTKKGKLHAGAQGDLSVNYKFTVGSNNQSFDYSPERFVSAEDANSTFHQGDIRQHNLNIAGGNNFLRYYGSYENRFEEGIHLNNKLERENLRANIDVFPSAKTSFSITAGYSNNNADVPQNDNNTRGWLGNTLLFATSYRFTDSLSIANLLNQSESDRFIGSFQGSWKPIKNLEARFSAGIDNSDQRWDEFLRSDLVYGGVTSGQRQVFTRGNKQLTFDFNARYNYNVGNTLQGTSIIGTQFFDRRRETAFFEVENFSTPLITDIGAGADIQNKGESLLHTREAGIFTSHQFSYLDQYFLTLGLRNDFASSVGDNAPDIFYPQASLAVRVDQYDFLPSSFDLLKFRLAYGETGVLPSLTDGIPLLWAAENGGYGAGAVLNNIGNLEIEPERVKEIELGFETEVLRNYSLEFTYYRQTARESIIDFRNAPSSGKTISAIPINIGQVDGWGIETLFQATPIRYRNFQLDFSLVNSFQTNEVKDLGGAQDIFDGFDVNVTKVGLPNHEFFVEDVIGAEFNEDGTYKGARTTDERVALGNPIPEYTGSFTFNLNLFKNFNAYVLADWATGHKIYNDTERFAVRFGNSPRFNRLEYQLGLVDTPPEGEEGLTQLSPGTPEYNEAAVRFANLDGDIDSNFIEDADFLKVR